MIDPILVSIGPIDVRWYSIAYILGIILGLRYIKLMDNNFGDNIITSKCYDNMPVYVVIGIVIGGRIGHVLFYNLDYYITHPLKIIYTWEGGMSFHGGFIGLCLALYMMCKKEKIHFLSVTDLVALGSPIGIFFGRLANYINKELYGRPTNISWGQSFLPYETIKRHPSQIYEALTEGLLLFMILNIIFIYTNSAKRTGLTSALFLIIYSFFRIIIENFREPDISVGYLKFGLTMGQVLSFPLLCLGLIILIRTTRRNVH